MNWIFAGQVAAILACILGVFGLVFYAGGRRAQARTNTAAIDEIKDAVAKFVASQASVAMDVSSIKADVRLLLSRLDSIDGRLDKMNDRLDRMIERLSSLGAR